MTQPILLLLLLVVRSSPVLGTEIPVIEGTSVTLVCNVGNSETCWGTTCSYYYYYYWFIKCRCSDPIVSSTNPNKYSLRKDSGMTILTISNLQTEDSRSYCCCTPKFIRSDFIDLYSLQVVKGCERNLVHNVDFPGNDIATKHNQQDANQCRELCTQNDRCMYFTFKKNSKICYLKASSISTITVRHNKLSISGYSLRNCTGKVIHSVKKYNLINERKNWTMAQKYCSQHFTNLAIIHTEEDWNAIQHMSEGVSEDMWIGLHINSSDEKWRWSDGKDFMYFDWEKGHDQNINDSFLCAISNSSHWRPVNCLAEKQYVCQHVHHENGLTRKVYKLKTEKKSLLDALNDCNDTDTDLASIGDQREQEAFDELTKGESWIGLQRDLSTFQWKWSSGEPFQKWKSSMSPEVGNCVKLNSEKTWEPDNCSIPKLFLCHGDELPVNISESLTTPATTNTTNLTSTGPPSTKSTTPPKSTSALTFTPPIGQSTTAPTSTATIGQSSSSTSTSRITSSATISPGGQPTFSLSSSTSPNHPDYLHYFHESKSWINALEFCEGRNSILVHITNQTVQDHVTQLLANERLQHTAVWIGLERSIFGFCSPWVWTSGPVVEYNQWHSCFPLNPPNYHCGKLVRVDLALQWLDACCHEELPFICQDLNH